MAGSVNKVILVGNLGSDPELKHIGNGGRAVCNLSVATNEKWKDKGGATQEKTEWHRVTVWGDLAENCAKYLEKGRAAYFEGHLQTRSWEDKDGQKKYMTEVVADRVVFLGGGEEGRRGGRAEAPPAGQSRQRDAAPPAGSDEDIPF